MPNLNDILESIPTTHGFPRPDWEAVLSWVFEHCPEEDKQSAALAELANQWLDLLAAAAGDRFEVFESDRFLIMTPGGRQGAVRLARVGEGAMDHIHELLPGIAAENPYGKFVCLVFDDQETYYHYISHFYEEEGEFAGSAGIFLRRGYPHFALNSVSPESDAGTLVHELTHASLLHGAFPNWLEEGITQVMEETILKREPFTVDRQEQARHQAYWGQHGLGDFWRGESFSWPDDGQELSYDLSQVFTRNLLSRGRDEFLRFLELLSLLDRGESALREVYGFGTGELATHFLGPGDWGWAPVEAFEFSGRGTLLANKGQYREAIRDFEKAIALDPEGSDSWEWLNGLAWTLCTCPDYELRHGTRAVELATRACELTRWEEEIALDTLAAAYAETRDFEQAIKWAKEAMAKAPHAEARADDESRLRLYEAGKPYREQTS